MVFAISLQADGKPVSRSRLEGQITQAGGCLLGEGFDELFEAQAPDAAEADAEADLVLTPAYRDMGFAALIADGHSRKAKYMQALALGLPCLAPQWIAASLRRGHAVDWEPYLLCAGASAVLGNALRSRVLSAYPAPEARLADVIYARRRVLGGQTVLAVSGKHKHSARQAYMFLTRAMGPALTRVASAEAARDEMARAGKAGTPFDWIYVDKGTVAGGAAAVLDGGKKRKRASVTGGPRVLDDELVIQSLILGRMVEEGEAG